MFDFDKSLVGGVEVAKICKDKFDFIYDEYPILFSGLNKHGYRVMGSYLNHDQDSDDDIIYYMHLIVSNSAYEAFLTKKITYRDLVDVLDEVYVLEKNYDSKEEIYYTLPKENLPLDYYPTEDSFCPDLPKKLGMKYNVRLTGKLADENLAITSHASVIANAFALLIEQSVNSLKLQRVKVLQKPSTEGSFKINFEVQIDGQQTAGAEKAILSFQNNFLEYCINSFHDEMHAIFSENVEWESAPKFRDVKNQFKILCETIGKNLRLEEKQIEELLKKDIQKSVSNLEKAVEYLGDGFDNIEFANVYSSSSRYLISNIDRDVKSDIDDAVAFIEAAENKVEEDDEYRDYKIHVYHMNTDSRTGNAIILYGPDNARVMSKPRIKIEGSSPLENTQYTQSLHSGEPVEVKARGRRIGNKFLSLLVAND